MNVPLSTGSTMTSITSRSIRRGITAAVVALLLAPRLHAQDPSQHPDSLTERLERAEEAIAALRQQIATQAGASVHTKSGVEMELSGRVLMNVFTNTRKNNNFDVPYFVRPRPTAPSTGAAPRNGTEQALGFSMRQTSVSGLVTVPGVLGGSFTGDMELDFFGGQMPSSGGRTFPLIRLRTARGIVRWSHAEWLIGQETVLISPQNPVSVASFGFPGFTGAGNLWLWLPQVRGTVEAGSRVRFAIQGAVLAPTAGQPVGFFDTDADSAEQSRSPFLQGRARVSWGAEETRGEIGAGVHSGRVVTTEPGTSGPVPKRFPSSAVSVDFLIPITSLLDIRGEGYDGKAVRGLGTGAIGQGIGSSLAPEGLSAVRTRAGWAQLNIHPVPGMTLGSGAGMDDPEDDDLPPDGRRKNVTIEGHLVWRFAGPLLAGAEWRQTTTRYRADFSDTNHHLNLAFGFVF